MRYLALVMLLAIALTGCGPPRPAGADKLAAELPGCEQVTSTSDMLAQQEVSCTTPDGGRVWARIATFANMTREQQWIQHGGSGTMSPTPTPGCCVKGNRWAAVAVTRDYPGDLLLLTSALGGHLVAGGPPKGLSPASAASAASAATECQR